MILDNRREYCIVDYKIIQKDDVTLAYIFNLNPQGFIVVSADDKITPIVCLFL